MRMRVFVEFRVLDRESVGRFGGGLIRLQLGRASFRLLQVVKAKRKHAVHSARLAQRIALDLI